MAVTPIAHPSGGDITSGHKRVIFASSLGTVFEWYDFYLYGALAAVIAKQFFSALDPTSGFIFALLAFAAGFAVRPFGALVFGRLGDMVGRKHTFLVTIVIMGLSTFFVGLLPSYNSIGVAAPIILILLRMLQGLALGGEYGGAATYVAEHAPNGKRGLYTSFIQTTATLGLFLSLLVILGCRLALGPEAFDAWGWRLPFLLSFVLLGMSVYIRMQLNESPLFQQMKEEGTHSKAPLKDSFGNWANARIVILALVGATAGQAVVWYAGQFYALFFLTQTLKVDGTMANLLMAAALIIATPFFVVFGWLSDRIGRKPIIIAGCVLAAATYFPLFGALTHYANPALEAAVAANPVVVVADPAQCSVQFDPIGKTVFNKSCDIAKSALARSGVTYANEVAPADSIAVIRVGAAVIPAFDGRNMAEAEFKIASAQFAATKTHAPAPKTPGVNKTMVLVILTILVLYVTMVYGPIAAWLVELFPTRIRYTSMSLPYHIGNGWFGGFLPTTAFALVAFSGDIYFGLWYPIAIALMTAVIGALFLPETKNSDIS
ncbi:MAG: MHS family MFS transporter [Ahniella sp.]|nr:MHS family MFS transporter [Ahniella sp.]